MKSYKFKVRRGINDLTSIHPWVASSQGDHSYSDKVTDEHDWLMFIFDGIDKTNQDAIDIEIERRIQYNKDYVVELMKSGDYGSVIEHTLILKNNPMFDKDISSIESPVESYKFVMLDLSKDKDGRKD